MTETRLHDVRRNTALLPGQLNGQGGAVMIVSLILLLILTMGVLSANRDVVVQEKATAAVREANVVFQVAESALIEAEASIDGLALAAFVDDGSGGLYALGQGPGNYLAENTWLDSVSIAASQVEQGYSARYFIEHLGQMTVAPDGLSLEVKNNYKQQQALPTAEVFRVVVRAEGEGGTPVRLVSAYYSH